MLIKFIFPLTALLVGSSQVLEAGATADFLGLDSCSLTCGGCPDDCSTATCLPEPIPLPPKSEFWPPEDILQRPYGPDPIPANLTAEYDWWMEKVLSEHPVMMTQSETEYALTEEEEMLVKMTLSEWIPLRASGNYTCEQMTTAIYKRAQYLQEIQHMNHFMYWDSFDWGAVAMSYAKMYDDLAATEGTTEVLAPLYCYPVPLKGTMSTVDFPSSGGFAALHFYNATVDAELTTLLLEANGVPFGKTNVPEHAHSYGTGNYANGLCFSPWGYDYMTGGSSGGSGAAVAAYTSAIAITEDTYGSTNTPAVRNHLFGYDPPKFHYPNGGNPSLTYRNDQLGLNARSIDDIITFDMAVLNTTEAHAKAKAYVDSLSNSDITIGCSDVYYAYGSMTPAIAAKYEEAKAVLMEAGFSFVEECQTVSPMEVVPYDKPDLVWYATLEEHITETLGLESPTAWETMLNGFYDFGTSLSASWMYDNQVNEGCALVNQYDEGEAMDAYLGWIPANRSDAYNEYFDDKGVDLMMGPTHICDRVLWSEDIGGSVGKNAGCDGGQLNQTGGCMFSCHSLGVTGWSDKTFTKAKFVVPIGLTEIDEIMSLHFMSRAGPRDPTIPAMEWVYDEEGPKTWNLEELYMVKRITDALEAAGLERADATMNYVSGLLEEETEGDVTDAPVDAPDTSDAYQLSLPFTVLFVMIVMHAISVLK